LIVIAIDVREYGAKEYADTGISTITVLIRRAGGLEAVRKRALCMEVPPFLSVAFMCSDRTGARQGTWRVEKVAIGTG